MTERIKIAMGLPWYMGADRDCCGNFMAFFAYLGRLQERLDWIADLKANGVSDEEVNATISSFPKLDAANSTGWSEIPTSLYGTRFQFGIGEQVGCSLPGMARERIVEASLTWGADFIFWTDADMMFGTDTFLRLYMAQKPVVAALAFTGRKPVTPVIYSFTETPGENGGKPSIDIQPVHFYEQDTLQKVDAIGSGVMLIDCNVFAKVPKPWFTSYGMGEDIFFCYRCRLEGVEVWVDTRAKAAHKPTFHERWHSEDLYLEERQKVQA